MNVSSGVSPVARLAKYGGFHHASEEARQARRQKSIKSVKSAPPEAYLAGVGVLVGGAAVLLLATTKSGQELLIRTAQLALRPEADEQESQESDVQEDAHNEPAEDADVEEEKDTNDDGESKVTGLKPRKQRPRSQGRPTPCGKRPRTPTSRRKRTPTVTTSPRSQTEAAQSATAQPSEGPRPAESNQRLALNMDSV